MRESGLGLAEDVYQKPNQIEYGFKRDLAVTLFLKDVIREAELSTRPGQDGGDRYGE